MTRKDAPLCCWECGAKLAIDKRTGGLFFTEVEVYPGVKVKMHKVCADNLLPRITAQPAEGPTSED